MRGCGVLNGYLFNGLLNFVTETENIMKLKEFLKSFRMSFQVIPKDVFLVILIRKNYNNNSIQELVKTGPWLFLIIVYSTN